MSSCVSNFIVGFNKTKYTVNTNVPSPKVSNTKDVKSGYQKTTSAGNSTTINVFRNKSTYLKVSKPGYQTRYIDVYPTNKRLENKLLDIGGGAILTGAGLALVYYDFSTSSATSIYGSLFISRLLLGYGIGNIYSGLFVPTPGPYGAYAGFAKPTIDIELYPDSLANPGRLDVLCDEFKLDIKKGTVLGNLYSYKKKWREFKMEDSVTTTFSSLIGDVNNHLSNVHLLRSISSIEKSKSIFDKSIDPAYILRAEVKSINIDGHLPNQFYYGNNTLPLVIKSKITIEWKVYDKLERLLFTKTTDGWGQRTSQIERDDNSNNAAENSLEDAVQTAVNKLVFSNDFSKYITKYKDFKNNNASEKFNSKLLITKPKGLNKSSKFLPEASKSVVTIIRKDSHGSGTIISPDGYILTNAHVCGNDTILKIRFKNGDETDAKIVRMNVDEDLALLKFDNKNKIEGLVMAFGISEVAVADEVYVIGTPADLSLNQSISRGLISGDRIIKNKKLYQTDAAINGGNSGGAMLDANGILIGIPSSKIKGKGLEGLGFAIPSGTAIEFLKLGYK